MAAQDALRRSLAAVRRERRTEPRALARGRTALARGAAHLYNLQREGVGVDALGAAAARATHALGAQPCDARHARRTHVLRRTAARALMRALTAATLVLLVRAQDDSWPTYAGGPGGGQGGGQAGKLGGTPGCSLSDAELLLSSDGGGGGAGEDRAARDGEQAVTDGPLDFSAAGQRLSIVLCRPALPPLP